jgi:hypothetical protein
MNNEILTIKEIQDAGFIHTPYVAFAYNKDTDAIYDGEDSEPKLALTYLLGEEKEWDIRLHDVDGVKKRAIEQMKKLGIKWVYSVYYGEIYIPKDQTNGDRYHHIFARAAIKHR